MRSGLRRERLTSSRHESARGGRSPARSKAPYGRRPAHEGPSGGTGDDERGSDVFRRVTTRFGCARP